MEIVDSLVRVFQCYLEAPIFIAVSTILALVSLRNGHLSDRARECMKKFEKTDKGDKMADSYKDQANEFIERYKKTGDAFGYLLIVLISSIGIKLTAEIKFVNIICILVWIITLGYSIVLISQELWKGRNTLKMEAHRVGLFEDDEGN